MEVYKSEINTVFSIKDYDGVFIHGKVDIAFFPDSQNVVINNKVPFYVRCDLTLSRPRIHLDIGESIDMWRNSDIAEAKVMYDLT